MESFPLENCEGWPAKDAQLSLPPELPVVLEFDLPTQALGSRSVLWRAIRSLISAPGRGLWFWRAQETMEETGWLWRASHTPLGLQFPVRETGIRITLTDD